MACQAGLPSGASASASMYARWGRSNAPGRAVTPSLPAAGAQRAAVCSHHSGRRQPANGAPERQVVAAPLRRGSERRAEPSAEGAALSNGEVVGLANLTAEQVLAEHEQREPMANVTRGGDAQVRLS